MSLVALVTGASGGIGGAIAAALGTGGATVGLVGRDRGALEAAAARSGAGAAVFRADLTRDHDVATLAERIGRSVDRLDVLVHAAGALVPGAAADADVKDLDAQYRVNVRAPWTLTQALLPLLRASAGCVVFVTGEAARRSPAGHTQYGATQHALRGLADALRDEVRADGVRVMTVEAGPTATPLSWSVHAQHGRMPAAHELLAPHDLAAAVVAALSLPPTVEVTDLVVRAARRA